MGDYEGSDEGDDASAAAAAKERKTREEATARGRPPPRAAFAFVPPPSRVLLLAAMVVRARCPLCDIRHVNERDLETSRDTDPLHNVFMRCWRVCVSTKQDYARFGDEAFDTKQWINESLAAGRPTPDQLEV